jgi:hypothetical protein
LNNLLLQTSSRPKVHKRLAKQGAPLSLELKRLAQQAAAEGTSRRESTPQPLEPQPRRNPPRSLEVRDQELPTEPTKRILTTFRLTASTGAQTRTRLGSWMKMQLLKENRQKRKRKLGERPTLPLLPVLQNRKRSPPAPSSARPTPAMKQIKCAKVKAAPTEAATTS